MHDRKMQAERTAGEWTAITDAIGTDGRTLRKIAQCYTLRFLIAHANAEIRKFNTRYELVQVKHSLGIRVIDHDRADDIRDTTSLSGGETFIVSLGLALGLSALSSRNISFDNLFIDEGFGTLERALEGYNAVKYRCSLSGILIVRAEKSIADKLKAVVSLCVCQRRLHITVFHYSQ